jgi:hypothetical protein
MEDADMGLAEGYVAGEWDVAPHLTGLIALLAHNQKKERLSRSKTAILVSAVTIGIARQFALVEAGI